MARDKQRKGIHGKEPSPDVRAEAQKLLHSKRGLIEKKKAQRPKPSRGKILGPDRMPDSALADKEDYENLDGTQDQARYLSGSRGARQKSTHDIAIARMITLGYSVKDIGQKLGLQESTVYAAMDRLEDIMHQRAIADLAKQRAETSLQLDALFSECLEGLRESKKPQVTKTVDLTQGSVAAAGQGQDQADGRKVLGAASKERVSKKTVDRTADVNYIFAGNSLLQTKMKLLGTAAPQDLRLVIETQEAGQRKVLDILKKHVKDPATLRAIAQELLEDNTEPSAETAKPALYPAEDTEERE